MNQYKVTYMDRKGAGCVRHFTTEDQLQRFIERLHAAAKIYFNDVEIGQVWRTDGADDRRIKWAWCFESRLIRRAQ